MRVSLLDSPPNALALVLLLGIFGRPAPGSAAGLPIATTAAEIVAAAREAQQVGSTIQLLRMVVVDRSGAEKTRDFELAVRKDGPVTSTLARFTAPADVAGTALVIIDRPGPDDERLLYLPALRRVTGISGKARGGAFIGSDFRFEDLELDQDATHTLLREDAVSWVIDSKPRGESAYSHVVATIWKADHLAHQVEFFDKRGAPAKSLDILETRKEGAVLLPQKTRMTDRQKGTSTRIEVISLRLNVPEAELPAALFTREGLLALGGSPTQTNTVRP